MIDINKTTLAKTFADAINVIDAPLAPQHQTENIKLLVWEGALHSPEIENLFSNALWPEKILDTFRIENGWDWKVKHGLPDTEHSPSEIHELVRLASGTYGNPAGNVHLALKIREYADTSSPLGGLFWWEDKAAQVTQDSEGSAVYQKLCQVLQEASQTGWNLFVEGISITIAKDGNKASYSPTSTLHSDRHHKPMQAGVCSIKEDGFELGGTLLLPNTKMSQFPEDVDLTFENISPLIQDKPAVLSESYDLHVFGGLKDEFENVHNDNGLPHISRDPPGKSARLIFLFRTQPQRI